MQHHTQYAPSVSLSRTAWHLWAVFALLVVLHQVTVHFGYLHWFLDIWSHFQLQIFVIGSVLLGLLARLARSRIFVVVGMLYVAGCMFSLLPMHWQEAGSIVEPMDLYFQNVLVGQDSQSHINMAKTLAQYPVDIFAFVEPHRVFAETFAKELNVKPLVTRFGGGASCAVFVQNDTYVPQSAVVHTSLLHDPLCVVSFEQFDLFVAHPLPPINAERFSRQAAYFAVLQAKIESSKRAGRPWVVIGDFNSTTYSSLFRKYFGAYTNTNHYTWQWPSLLTIPIDHVFGEGIDTVSLHPAHTSDHRGFGITLSF